ncbi:MAG: ABC transporter ATP-binding protein [Candidatus Cryptobacteroides sp.]|nr:ATP-binding cassette domain-containing protein [Bacteroidales bacterium]
MIQVKDIRKSFGDKTVLKDININFEPGKCNMLIGASGSGKTVLMNIVSGLVAPDSGKVLYDDKDLTKMGKEEKKLIHQKIGMLFQGSALFDFRTVLGNVMFPMDFLTDWSLAEKKERARYLLDKVNVKDAEDKYPDELSGGMQKRVGIARAIALNPEYLFCDEPNSGLDPETSIVIDRLISSITKEFSITTILNTHDMNSIMEIGDNIGFLYQGEIIWQGDRNSIMSTDCPQLVEFLCSNTLARNILRKG